jgi:hypothetical protein
MIILKPAQRWILGAVLCLFLTGPCCAQAVESGSHLLEACQLSLGRPEIPLDSAKAGFCLGSVRSLFVFGRNHPESFCAPIRVTVDQVIRVLVKNLNATPKLNDMPAEVRVIGAFKKEWPCSGGSGKGWSAPRGLELAAVLSAFGNLRAA